MGGVLWLAKSSAFITNFSRRRILPEGTALLPVTQQTLKVEPACISVGDLVEEILVPLEYKWLLYPLSTLRTGHPFKGSKQHLKG